MFVQRKQTHRKMLKEFIGNFPRLRRFERGQEQLPVGINPMQMADRTVGQNPKRIISDINLRVLRPYGE